MTLLQILIFVGFALLVAVLRSGRGWLLLAGSVLAMYWMQPSTPIRNLDFWLPTVTLGLTIFVWAVTRPGDEKRADGEDWIAGAVMAGIVLLVGLTRYLPSPACCLTPSRPPDLWKVAVVVILIGLASLVLARSPAYRAIPQLATFLLIGLFLVLKTDLLARAASVGLRTLTGQSIRLASALDIRWLGFSYLAFRLIHTLRDRLTGKLPALSLREFVTYAVFFPSFTAGPIDRVQRFTQDLRKAEISEVSTDSGNLSIGGQRILLGIFKKFALADSLALIALNGTNATQAHAGPWLWVLLYAYALRIYFDFSGYTDIAIGLGRLMGFSLPENFARPYIKPNLTVFWNSWHITLAQWFRAYFFNPLTRALRSSSRGIPMWAIILVGQLSTMLLIGLWHGVTWSFVAWGLWHGIGLFAHNRWTEFTRPRLAGLENHPRLQQTLSIGGTLLTFHYVTLGWVWFALPSVQLSWKVFLKLLGG